LLYEYFLLKLRIGNYTLLKEKKMLDMPLVQAGAIVSLAISNDEDHPASNVIDG
jgi:hypothetical protein